MTRIRRLEAHRYISECKRWRIDRRPGWQSIWDVRDADGTIVATCDTLTSAQQHIADAP